MLNLRMAIMHVCIYMTALNRGLEGVSMQQCPILHCREQVGKSTGRQLQMLCQNTPLRACKFACVKKDYAIRQIHQEKMRWAQASLHVCKFSFNAYQDNIPLQDRPQLIAPFLVQLDLFLNCLR